MLRASPLLISGRSQVDRSWSASSTRSPSESVRAGPRASVSRMSPSSACGSGSSGSSRTSMRARPFARPVRSVSCNPVREPTCPAVWTRCTTVRTASSRGGSSSSGGTRNGIRAAAILRLARVIRRATPASPVRRTAAIAATSTPQTRRRVSATCDSRVRAGWQQVKTSRSGSVGPGASSAAGSMSNGSFRRSVASRRSRSRAILWAVVVSQPTGLSGTPSGQVSRARSTASCAQSSARSRSLVSRAVEATTIGHVLRKTSSGVVIRRRRATP